MKKHLMGAKNYQNYKNMFQIIKIQKKRMSKYKKKTTIDIGNPKVG